MDLSTIQGKINNNAYGSAADFEYDVRLMFKNCYKFNPAGSPVHNMGRRLEAVFDQKWAEKPSLGDDSGNSSDYDSEHEDNYQQLQAQLAAMQERIASMSNRKKSVSGHAHPPKKVSSGSSMPKKPKKKEPPPPPLIIDYAKKQELAEKVGTLEGDALQHAISIIRSGMPNVSFEEDEVELDLENMNPTVLQRLYKFVVLKNGGNEDSVSHSRKQSTAGPAAAHPHSKPRKHKPMNENEQDAAIRRAQRQLAKLKGEAISPSGSEADSSDEGVLDNDDVSSSEEE